MEQPPNPNGQQPGHQYDPFAAQPPQPPQVPPQQPQPYPTPTPSVQPSVHPNPYGQPVEQNQPASTNPYAAPQAQGDVPFNSEGGMSITTTAFMSVLGTRVWVMIISIVFLVLTGLQLVSIFMTGVRASRYVSLDGFDVFSIYIMPLAFSALYIMMSVRLIQYGGAIGKLKVSQNSMDFEKAIADSTS